METLVKRPKAVKPSNKRNLSQHPFFFGNYLNMARHNAFQIIKHLSDKYRLDEADTPQDDGKLADAALLNLLKMERDRPDEVRALVRDLMGHFPFLKFLFGEDEQNLPNPDAVRKVLTQAFTLLNQFRNGYSHHIAKRQFNQGFPFEKIYSAGLERLIKRFYYYTDVHKTPLLHTDYAAANQLVPTDITDLSRPVPRKSGENREGGAISELSVVYFTCLFLERKYAFEFLRRINGFENSEDLHHRAKMETYTMFCCRLPQPKLESGDVMLDMLNELGRCPDDLYYSLAEEDRKKFVMKVQEADAGDEEGGQEVVLKRHEDRFPYFALRYFDDIAELPTLRFHLQLGKVRKKEKYLKVMFNAERERVLQKPLRTFGRFMPFYQLYENINQDDREQKIIDKRFVAQFPAEWKQQVPKSNNWRLRNDFKKDEEDKALGKTPTEGDKIAIDQFSPQYNIRENSIGFKFVTGAEDRKLPPLDQTDLQPDAIISVYELHSMFLYDHLHKKGWIETDTETYIQDFIKRLKQLMLDVKTGKFAPLKTPPDYTKNEKLPWVKDKIKTKELRTEFKAVQNGMKTRREQLAADFKAQYNIPINAVPDALCEYLLAYHPPVYSEQAIQKFKTQLKFVEQQLKAVAKSKAPKIGEMATWLAEDIVDLMPQHLHTAANGITQPQKINKDQFRILQASLAYFSINKEKIRNYFEELNLDTGNTAQQHPFIKDIILDNCRGILDFYEIYLGEKQEWLNIALNFMAKNKRQPEAIDTQYGYILGLPKPVPTQEANKRRQVKNYDKLPVLLPRGLFKDAISAAMQTQGYASKDNFTKLNTIFAFDKLLDADTQDFYLFKRSMKITDKSKRKEGEAPPSVIYEQDAYFDKVQKGIQSLKARQAKNRDKKLNFTDKNKLKDLKHDEDRILQRKQVLRYTQSTDRALWLMVKDRAKDKHLTIDFNNLNLAHLDTVLTQEVAVSLNVSGITVKDTLPIRRYGDFRRILKDRRLANLLKYAPQSSSLDRAHIEEELRQYDIRREQFFETIYTFEKTVYALLKDKFPTLVEGVYDHKTFMEARGKEVKKGDTTRDYYDHWVYMCLLTESGIPLSTAQKTHYLDNVTRLRNKFLHNEIPYFEDWLTAEVAAEKGAYMCDKIFNIAQRYYDDLLKLIK